MGILSTAILAAFMAFLSIRLYSSVDAHLGDHGVQIRSYESDEARENFFFDLAGFARETGFEVVINYSSLSVSNGEYRTYSSALKPGSERVERARFERGEVDILYPLEEFPQADPRQIIFIKGSSADRDSLVRWLEKQGFTVETLTNKLAQIFLVSTIPILLLLSVLLCVLLGAGHSLSRSREIGVHRLLGLSVWETAWHEVQRQRAPFLVAWCGIPLVIALCLYVYNRWALGSLFWLAFLLSGMALGFFLGVGYLSGQCLVRLTSIPQSIKGRIHARPIFYALTIVRCITLVAALTAVTALVGAGAELSARQNLQKLWDANVGPQEFALNTNTSFEELTDRKSVDPFRETDKAGALLLVDPYWITWPIELEAPVLLVNQTFAQQAGVTELAPKKVTVCSPMQLSGDSKKTIHDALDFEAGYAGTGVPPVEWRESCSVRDVFTYDVEFWPVVNNPILVVLPPGLSPLGNHNLMSKVSQQVLLSASSDVPHQLIQGDTGNTLSFTRPREASWQESMRKVQQKVALWGLNTLAAVLLVTMLVAATLSTYRIAYRRKIHIAYICGRSPWWVVRPLAAIEIVFFFLSVGWLLYKVRQHSIDANLHMPSTWNIGFENQWSAPTVLALVGFGISWLIASVIVALRSASQWDMRDGMEQQ
ncbi:hypothetical protein [Corynebacterium renale]|uniref:hypothetical protein n=2 Tax=Corynebacterium renale TaxID=1724 RepID=UPI0011AB5BAC|nr:hypothetical protein [Corynebacterium renale]